MAHPPSQLTSALFTQVGASIWTGTAPPPLRGRLPLSYLHPGQCEHSFTKSGTKVYAKLGDIGRDAAEFECLL
jgi:hypothetical protein